MAKIVLSLDGDILEQRVVREERLVLGRNEDCDLTIDAPDVSGRHAVIVTVVNDHFLEDLGSTNGTLVNGKRITRHLLENNDVVFLGPYRLKYQNLASVGVGFDRTQIITPVNPQVEPANTRVVYAELDSAAASTKATRSRFPKGKLVGVAGPRADDQLPIDGVLMPVGREGDSLAVINRRPLGCYITQVSGAAARLNGRALGSEAELLKDGDKIEAGEETVIFQSA